MNTNQKKLIYIFLLFIILLVITIIYSFFIADNTIKQPEPETYKIGRVKIKDENSTLYKNITTSKGYEGFLQNLTRFIESKNGDVNDEVVILSARERGEGVSYPRFIKVYIPSLSSEYEIIIDISTEDKSYLSFTVKGENYSDYLEERDTDFHD